MRVKKTGCQNGFGEGQAEATKREENLEAVQGGHVEYTLNKAAVFDAEFEFIVSQMLVKDNGLLRQGHILASSLGEHVKELGRGGGALRVSLGYQEGGETKEKEEEEEELTDLCSTGYPVTWPFQERTGFPKGKPPRSSCLKGASGTKRRPG